MSTTGGQWVTEALHDEDVRHVFGLIGSSTMELLDGLYHSRRIEYIGVHDERTGTHMADAYARVSGRPGVVMAGQNGPGVTNLVTGLAQALRAYSPVVSLGGALARGHRYREAFQEIDQPVMLRPVTKETYYATSTASAYDLVRQAFGLAMAPRRGPVHVDLPRDVLGDSCDTGGRLRGNPPAHTLSYARTAAVPAHVTEAARLLAGAARPFIVAGGGVKAARASQPVLALAERLGCPVGASAGHGDAVPTDHPLAVGQVGPRGNPVATELLREADVLLLLGTRLGFNNTMFAPDALAGGVAVIHVDQAAAVIGREFPVAVGIAADAATVAEQLADVLQAHIPREEVTRRLAETQRRTELLWQEREAGGESDQVPLQPGRVFQGLRRVLPADTIITLDAGTMCLQATDSLRYGPAPSVLTPLDFGLVGFSFAAGLGAKLAAPDRPVVSLIGDGGFGMTLSELSTAVANDINTNVIVLDNGVWGAEKSYQRDFFGERYIGSDLQNPPFEAIARLYGAAGFRVQAADQVEDVVRAALAEPRPSVVVIPVDEHAMVSFRRDSFAQRSLADAR